MLNGICRVCDYDPEGRMANGVEDEEFSPEEEARQEDGWNRGAIMEKIADAEEELEALGICPSSNVRFFEPEERLKILNGLLNSYWEEEIGRQIAAFE